MSYKLQVTNYKFCFLLSAFCFLLSSTFTAVAQNSHELKINEMFINNHDNLMDVYGNRMPWLEIFNTSQVNLDIADYYLTNDTTGLSSKEVEDKAHWYKIPKGDTRTIIPQGGYLVFFLGNTPQYGTLHTNFNPLDTPYSNYVALIHPNGHELIHLFSFPEDLRSAEQSYGYAIDYGPETFMRDSIQLHNLRYLNVFSPNSTNNHEPKPVKETPKNAVWQVIFATLVLFSALFLSLIFLKSFGKWYSDTRNNRVARRSAKREAAEMAEMAELARVIAPPTDLDDSEEIAAIGMALHLYLDANHDEESEILTFDTTALRYSPWAQKNLVLKRVTRK